MKDTQGNPITEEEFMKDIGHGVGMQDWKSQLNWIVKGTGADEASIQGLVNSLLKEERYKGYEEGRDDGFKEGKNAVLSEAIALSDLIESQNITVFDEWRAFKQFRNTLRDKLKHK